MTLREQADAVGAWSFAGLTVALTAVGAIAVVDGWRPAALVVVASGTVAATRLRFSDRAAVGLLAVAAAVTLAGHGLAGDERPSATKRGSAVTDGGEPPAARARESPA